MAIIIKNNSQIELMRSAGRIVAKAHEAAAKAIKPGVTTLELDMIIADTIKSHGAASSFLGYEGSFGAGPFPSSACISINDEVIHGLPGLRKLNDGDIVSIDIGAYKDGFHGDAARSYAVGEVSACDRRLVEVTMQSFFEGIKFAKAGNHLYEISKAIQSYVEPNGFSVVRNYVGHGIGSSLHESPEIPNYKPQGRGPALVPGMALAIEPMVNAGSYGVKVLDNQWTVVTADGKKSAHYENTILITGAEPEILTLL